jgi:hypothetical protein
MSLDYYSDLLLKPPDERKIRFNASTLFFQPKGKILNMQKSGGKCSIFEFIFSRPWNVKEYGKIAAIFCALPIQIFLLTDCYNFCPRRGFFLHLSVLGSDTNRRNYKVRILLLRTMPQDG